MHSNADGYGLTLPPVTTATCKPIHPNPAPGSREKPSKLLRAVNHFRIQALLPRRWRLREIRRARLTRGLLLVGVLFMLWSQAALAAYACMSPSGSMASSAISGTSMRATCPQMMHSAADHMVCTKHCAPDASTSTVTPSLSVPPSVVAALPPVLPDAVALVSPVTAGDRQRDRLRAPPPPPSLLFCSLLI